MHKPGLFIKKKYIYLSVLFVFGLLVGLFSRFYISQAQNAAVVQPVAENKLVAKSTTPKPKKITKKTPEAKITPVVSNTPKAAPPEKVAGEKTQNPVVVTITPLNTKPAPEPVQAKPSTPPIAVNTPQAASTILDLINEARRANGLVAVRYNSTLNTAAFNKSKDMYDRKYFSHTTPDGKSDFDFVKALGYTYQAIGSNIAMGYASDKDVFDGWMASDGHRANIMASWGVEIGYGAYNGYYTMFIANPM